MMMATKDGQVLNMEKERRKARCKVQGKGI
jgi:hypothetical protein